MFERKKNVFNLEDLSRISGEIDGALRGLLKKEAQEVEEESRIMETYLAQAKKIGKSKRHAEKEMLEEMTNLKNAISADLIFKPEESYPEVFETLEKLSAHGQRFGFAIKIFIDLVDHQLSNLEAFEQLEEKETPLSAGDKKGISEERTVIGEMRGRISKWIIGIRNRANGMQDILSRSILQQYLPKKELPEKRIRGFFNMYEGIQSIETDLKAELKKIQNKYKGLSRDVDRELKVLKKGLGDATVVNTIATNYRELNMRHPKVLYGIGVSFLLLSTVGALFAVASTLGGIGAIFGIAKGFSALGFITSGGFALVSGPLYAFITDWGPKLSLRVANAT